MNNDEINKQINQAFITHFKRYMITNPYEQIDVIKQVLNGDFNYITRYNGARDILEYYGVSIIKKCIFESSIVRFDPHLAQYKANMPKLKNNINKNSVAYRILNFIESINKNIIPEKEIKYILNNLDKYFIDFYAEGLSLQLQTELQQNHSLNQATQPKLSQSAIKLINETDKIYNEMHIKNQKSKISSPPKPIEQEKKSANNIIPIDINNINNVDFNAMSKTQIQNCLIDTQIIHTLLTTPITQERTYPKLGELLIQAQSLSIEDKYYVLFTNGYVANVLLSEIRKTRNNIQQSNFTDTKFNIIVTYLTHMPSIISKFLNDPATTKTLSYTDDVRPIFYQTPKLMNQVINNLNIEITSQKRIIEQYQTKLMSLEHKRMTNIISVQEYRNQTKQINQELMEPEFRISTMEKNVNQIDKLKHLKTQTPQKISQPQNKQPSTSNFHTVESQQDIQQKQSKKNYDKAKQIYNNISSSQTVVNNIQGKDSKEIDADLDDFDKQERQILNAKHFTDEQKKRMIEELYTKFDNYVEQNPETQKSK